MPTARLVAPVHRLRLTSPTATPINPPAGPSGRAQKRSLRYCTPTCERGQEDRKHEPPIPAFYAPALPAVKRRLSPGCTPRKFGDRSKAAFLTERYVKCGKATCGCRDDSTKRHGPYFSWTRAIAGETHSQLLRPEQAEIVRQQIAAGAEFRGLVEQFWEASERLADEQIAPQTDASPETAEKGGSKASSKRRSRPKSRG